MDPDQTSLIIAEACSTSNDLESKIIKSKDDLNISSNPLIENGDANSQTHVANKTESIFQSCLQNTIIEVNKEGNRSCEISENESSYQISEETGLFGWSKIDGTAIPFIRRRNRRYVIVSIAERFLFHKFSPYFTEEFAKCVIAPRYSITETEVKIFNEVNEKLCDGVLNKNNFTLKDVLVLIEDVTKMVEFLKASYELIYENKTDNRLFGFVKINNENSVPFVCFYQLKFLPLFYFDGCDIENFGFLSDRWQINYFRLCFKIQKIKKDLYDNAKQIKVVNLDLIRKLFPKGTRFEIHCPSEINEELLVKKIQLPIFTLQPKLPKKATCPSEYTQIIDKIVTDHISIKLQGIEPRPANDIGKSSTKSPRVVSMETIGSTNTGTLVKPLNFKRKSRHPNILTKSFKSPVLKKKLKTLKPTPALSFIDNINTNQGIERFPKNDYSMITITTPTLQFPEPIVAPIQPSNNLLRIDSIEQPQDSGRGFSDSEVGNLVINVPDDSPAETKNNDNDILMTSKCQRKIKLYLRDFFFPVIECTLPDKKLRYIISLTDLREKLFPKWPFKTFNEEVKPWLYDPFIMKEESNQYDKAIQQFGVNNKSYCCGIFAVCSNITDVEKACAHLDLIESPNITLPMEVFSEKKNKKKYTPIMEIKTPIHDIYTISDKNGKEEIDFRSDIYRTLSSGSVRSMQSCYSGRSFYSARSSLRSSGEDDFYSVCSDSSSVKN